MGIPSSFIADALEDIKRAGLYRAPRVIEEVRGPHVVVDDKELLCFCSNDYLGIAQRPELVEAAHHAARESGWGSGSARLLSGTSSWHVDLEESIARFKKTEAALYFPSGFMANLAMITVAADEQTVILSDQLNHASVVDACRLSRATVEVYPHGNVDDVISLLRKHKGARRRIIVTDGIFSMDGDIAPLRELVGLASFHQAEIILDDAHGTGILGAHGRGVLEHFNLEGSVRMQSGGFGKAFGSSGGFVAGPLDVIDLLRNRARTFIYTTAPPPAVAAAAMTGLELVEKADKERKTLWRNADYLKHGLQEAGFDIAGSESPIIPIVIGDADRAMSEAKKLFDAGFLVPAIRPPTVPEGTSRLRISVSALHELKHLDALIETLKR